jgi:hypothetical protein
MAQGMVLGMVEGLIRYTNFLPVEETYMELAAYHLEEAARMLELAGRTIEAQAYRTLAGDLRRA